MECAGKGTTRRCLAPPTRRCARCQAVAYCSLSHQIAHWSVHKEECERLEEQMKHADELNDFPFIFAGEATVEVLEKRETRCLFLENRGLHRVKMWMCECQCGILAASNISSLMEGWCLASVLCPCREPQSPLQKQLDTWEDYYEWRSIPLHSPVAILLHWPLTLYWAAQLTLARSLNLEVIAELNIHYLGPDKELSQLDVFSELHALFPAIRVRLELVGPAVPEYRNGERIELYKYAHCNEIDCVCKSSEKNFSSGPSSVGVEIRLHAGYYHDRYKDLAKDSVPHLIVAPNAGIAAYTSWSPTIDLIKELNVPAVFTDYCEEASHLAASCLSTRTGRPLSVPIQLNPFRQPLVVEHSGLLLPCYSNCFLFGI
ncbi:hypothetical protein AgCh_018075 [Apium graveolens]